MGVFSEIKAISAQLGLGFGLSLATNIPGKYLFALSEKGRLLLGLYHVVLAEKTGGAVG